MQVDIGGILRDWPYEPGQVSARRIRGADGRDKIQLRLDLGLLQMEVEGRPDGHRPHGYESLLDYQEHLLQRHIQDSGSEEGFSLDEKVCEMLRAESLMYYHRYLAEFILEDFQAVERDTMRNLRVLDFCNSYAHEQSDRYVMEQFRPYLIMMCTRARARLAMNDSRFKSALSAVNKGIEQIRQFHKRYGQQAAVASSSELMILKALAKEVESHIPVDPVHQMRKDLARAVREERYEEAAALRDRLRRATGADEPDTEAENEEHPQDPQPDKPD